jgi:peptide/nickel transport system permease protein
VPDSEKTALPSHRQGKNTDDKIPVFIPFYIIKKLEMMSLSMKQLGMRFGEMVLVLIGISFITFCLIMLSPGDPVRQMIAGNEDIIVSQVEIDALRHELGLDKPFLLQYLDWLGRVVQGNFGFSFMMKKPVIDAIMEALPASVILALASSLFMLVFSIPLGIYTAVKQNTWFDYLVRGCTFAGVSVPNFWMGLMLLWVFALKLSLFPIVGGSISLENLILPMCTLGIVMASKYTRQVRATVLEELHQDYVMGARARGLSESHILWREVLPNALLPLVTLFGLAFGSLLGGAAVVEIVFSWPGLGYMVVQAITYRDFQTVQAIVLWIAFMYMMINLIVDLSYNRLDPRLRKGGH